jgi:hypothetical protein
LFKKAGSLTNIPTVSDVKLNLPVMLKAKNDAVSGLTKGIEHLFKQNKVDYIKGTGSFLSPTRLSIALNDGGETEIEAKVSPHVHVYPIVVLTISDRTSSSPLAQRSLPSQAAPSPSTKSKSSPPPVP